MAWYLVHHHPKHPYATGPYASEVAAIAAAGANPLPSGISLHRADPDARSIGRCPVYPARAEVV